MSELAEQKGCPFRVTTINACVYGILDNHKKGAIVCTEREARDDLPTSDTHLYDRDNSSNTGD